MIRRSVRVEADHKSKVIKVISSDEVVLNYGDMPTIIVDNFIYLWNEGFDIRSFIRDKGEFNDDDVKSVTRVLDKYEEAIV